MGLGEALIRHLRGSSSLCSTSITSMELEHKEVHSLKEVDLILEAGVPRAEAEGSRRLDPSSVKDL